jgi:hypothetical protein
LSEKSAALLIEKHGALDVQLHAMYCLWMIEIDHGKVQTPPNWLTASLKGGLVADWETGTPVSTNDASIFRKEKELTGFAKHFRARRSGNLKAELDLSSALLSLPQKQDLRRPG